MNVTRAGHTVRVVGLMVLAAALFGWLAAHTDICFADGLRYIGQAKQYAGGSWSDVIRRGVDHPVYPMTISATHRLLGLGDTPEGWQLAAQWASVAAGVLLIAPLYWLVRELFGDAPAFPSCLVVILLPLTGHVFADTLSESTFLLFWTTGLWAAFVFLRSGRLGWLPLVVIASALAYLTRPEGLLLPGALVAAIMLCPRWVFAGLGKRGLTVLAVLVVGSMCLVGPYIALKGGLGTKPSIARLLGTAPKSAAHAVERQRPLDPDQSPGKTFIIAGKAVLKAITDSITWPIVPFAVLGLVMLRPDGGGSRQWRLIAVIVVASMLALIRLHATGGYCTPRHAMILMLLAVPTAAFGFTRLVELSNRRSGVARRLGWTAAMAALIVLQRGELLLPVNAGQGGYREAGHWLASRPNDRARVVDVTGWSQYYGNRDGYTFENLISAASDPSARWVVVREAHLRGPWEYCGRLRALVKGLEPVAEFHGDRTRPTRIYLFDRAPILAARADAVRR